VGITNGVPNFGLIFGLAPEDNFGIDPREDSFGLALRELAGLETADSHCGDLLLRIATMYTATVRAQTYNVVESAQQTTTIMAACERMLEMEGMMRE